MFHEPLDYEAAIPWFLTACDQGGIRSVGGYV